MEVRRGVLQEDRKAILRRIEKAMCGCKVLNKKTTEEHRNMLGLEETVKSISIANGIRWYRHVLRR